MNYIRTDKNGTKIYHDYTCARCGGQGGRQDWVYTGFTCYECGGSGISPKPRIIREYTPEYAAKLAEKREARAKKLEEQRRQEAVERAQAWISEEFPEGKIYIVMGNTYTISKELKEAGAEYTSKTGWMFKHKPEGFTTVEMTADQCIRYDYYGFPYHSHDIYDNAVAKYNAMKPESQHIGNVGDKITITATYLGAAYFESYNRFSHRNETTYINKFETAEGNILVWKTGTYPNIPEGTQVEVTATIKAHSEYRGEKQTDLTRARVKEVTK